MCYPTPLTCGLAFPGGLAFRAELAVPGVRMHSAVGLIDDDGIAPERLLTVLSVRGWRHVQWLNTMLRTKTTITVDVMLDPKMTWKSEGNLL
jgi:hypothetical protein